VWRDGKPSYDEEWFRIYLFDHLYMSLKEPQSREPLGDFDLRDLTSHYLGLVTRVDTQVGRLLRVLEEQGMADNTLLIFTSDHGDNLGSHGQYNKCSLMEESIRIPMMWHWPGHIAPRAITRQVTSLIDVLPTSLALCGQEPPAYCQGTDVSPVILGQAETTGENAAYIESIYGPHAFWQEGGESPQVDSDYQTGSIGIRTIDRLYGMERKGCSMYGHEPEDDEIVNDSMAFFDLKKDPFQLNNLAGYRPVSDEARGFRQRLLQWHESTPWLAKGH
jgi:arylsulfatase A-like enzyme